MERTIGFLRLTRPANVVTAVSDILAGITISGFFFSGSDDYTQVALLILSTVGLYGGGVVMNDVFDAKLDAVERPERPIPSGLIKAGEAAAFGIMLLIAGVVFSFMVSPVSGGLAFAIAVAAVAYDKWGKHHSLFGPLNMGICRGLNLLLGVSILPAQLEDFWFLAVVPIIYIAAITMISRGEVHGGKRAGLYLAGALYLLAMGFILYVAVGNSLPEERLPIVTVLFLLVWAFMVFTPLKNAIRNPEGRLIGRSVKAGVLALILMNAAWASAFEATYVALIIVLLLPLSIMLAKVFAVT